MNDKILVISATGKTGFETAKQLLKEGYQVRILARSKNTKVCTLEKLGAEICIGNLTSEIDLNNALRNTKRVYYCHPFIPHIYEHTKLFIKCAKANNIEAIVNMGQWLAEFNDQKSIHTIETQKAYQLYEQSGLNVIQLMPVFFADNTFFITQFAIQLGLMPLPFGNGKNPAISNEDLGLVIASLLKNPEPYVGKRLRLTGPQSLSSVEMANVFSKVVGHRVRYVNIPEWIFLKAAFMFANEFGLDEFSISQVRHYIKEYQTNKFDQGGITGIVKELTGKDPDDFETIVRSYVNKSLYKQRSFSNWLLATRRLMILPFQSIPSIKELEKYNK